MADYPCETCKIKKWYAINLDFHWFDHEDCPYVCPFMRRDGADNE